MMKVLLLLVACCHLALCFTDLEYQNAFRNWMRDMEKSYTVEEFQTRYDAFKINMEFVHTWNTKNSSTVVALNAFADLTLEEYSKMYLGTRYDASKLLEQTARILPPNFPTSPNDVTVDWRTSGAVTPIKDQGQCGSCWSFSTTGSVEGAHQIATGQLVSLSEQNLMDCSQSYGNNGCNGGLMNNAFQYIINNKGIDTEASYPYTMTMSSCKFSIANLGATISSYKSIPSGSESALAASVMKQPVSVAIDANHQSFQLYSSGVYYEPACSSQQLDHGVLAIGYGTDSVDATDSTDYWIVKNSWGVSWGMQGFIKMSRNRNNNCGIASMASFPVV